jgi:hypothetical protein
LHLRHRQRQRGEGAFERRGTSFLINVWSWNISKGREVVFFFAEPFEHLLNCSYTFSNTRWQTILGIV